MENLIVALIIQGLGAGMMTPVSIALISELFPPKNRGGMIGAFSFVQLIANRLDALFPKIIWGLSLVGASAMYYAVNTVQFVLFNIFTGVLGMSLGAIMATLLINSQNAVSSEDRTILSGLVQWGAILDVGGCHHPDRHAS